MDPIFIGCGEQLCDAAYWLGYMLGKLAFWASVFFGVGVEYDTSTGA